MNEPAPVPNAQHPVRVEFKSGNGLHDLIELLPCIITAFYQRRMLGGLFLFLAISAAILHEVVPEELLWLEILAEVVVTFVGVGMNYAIIRTTLGRFGSHVARDSSAKNYLLILGMTLLYNVACFLLAFFLAVPAVVFAISASVALVAFVAEGTGVFDSIKRSLSLVGKNFRPTFAYLVPVFIATFGIPCLLENLIPSDNKPMPLQVLNAACSFWETVGLLCMLTVQTKLFLALKQSSEATADRLAGQTLDQPYKGGVPIITPLVEIFRHPRKFFQSMPTTGGYAGPLLFFATTLQSSLLLLWLMSDGPFQFATRTVLRVVTFVFTVGASHFFCKRIGGTGTLEGTIRACAFSTAPFLSYIPVGIGLYPLMLFALPPFKLHFFPTFGAVVGAYNIVVNVCCLYLLVLGLQTAHALPRGKAIFAGVAGFGFLFVCGVIWGLLPPDWTSVYREQANKLMKVIDPKAAERRERREDSGRVHKLLDATEQDLVKLDKEITQQPNNPRLRYYRALALRSMDRYPQAIEQLRAAISMSPTEAEYYYESAFCKQLAGKQDDAFSDINQAIRLKPHESRYLQERADLYAKRKDYKHAEEDLNAAIRVGSDGRSSALAARAEFLQARGRLDEAARDWQQIKHDDLYGRNAARSLAQIAAVRGDVSGALKCYLDWINEDQTDYFSCEDIAAIQQALQNPQKEREYLHLALKRLHANWPTVDGWTGLEIKAKYERALGMVEESRQDYARALRVVEKEISAHGQDEMAVYARERISKALAVLQKADNKTASVAEEPVFSASRSNRTTTQKPKSADDYIARAEAHYAKTLYREALADYATASKLDPKNAYPLERQANCLEKLGRLTAAIEIYRHMAQKFDSETVSAYGSISACYLNLHQHKEALRYANLCIKKDILNGRGYYERSKIESALGKQEEARHDRAIAAILGVTDDYQPVSSATLGNIW